MSYPMPEDLPDPNTIQPDPPRTPQPMEHGQASPAPDYDPVYPSGDPAIAAQPTQDGQYPVDQQGFTDLTNRRPRPRFRIGSELYEGKIEVAAGVMMKYSARAAKLDVNEEDFEANTRETLTMFRLLLKKDSAERLIAHLHMVPEDATAEDEIRIAEEADEDENSVGLDTFMKLMPWLMEQYGMAPTAPSSSASDGSSPNQDDGSDSTPTGPEVESTSSTSPSTGS